MAKKKTRVCTKCREEKPLDEFHHDRSKRGGRQTSCKACLAKSKRRAILRNQSFSNGLKRQMRCQRCGALPEDLSNLAFHHRDPATKEFNVSDAVGQGWALDRIAAEMEKCVVLCGDRTPQQCHAAAHAEMNRQETTA